MIERNACLKTIYGPVLFISLNLIVVLYYIEKTENRFMEKLEFVNQQNLSHENFPTTSHLTETKISFEENFPVHVFRFYDYYPSEEKGPLCYFECISLLSIFTFLNPKKIYFHTNFPDFWPFDSCENLTNKWMDVEIVPHRRKFVMAGQRLIHDVVHHEVDYAKLKTIEKYGGIVIDSDVYLLPDILAIFGILAGKKSCVASRESEGLMNMGFLACKKHSPYIQEIVRKYETEYIPDWLHNSGSVPMELIKHNKTIADTVYIDDSIANEPSDAPKRNHDLRLQNWRGRLGYHSFYHDCNYNATTFQYKRFVRLLQFIVDAARHNKSEQ